MSGAISPISSNSVDKTASKKIIIALRDSFIFTLAFNEWVGEINFLSSDIQEIYLVSGAFTYRQESSLLPKIGPIPKSRFLANSLNLGDFEVTNTNLEAYLFALLLKYTTFTCFNFAKNSCPMMMRFAMTNSSRLDNGNSLLSAQSINRRVFKVFYLSGAGF